MAADGVVVERAVLLDAPSCEAEIAEVYALEITGFPADEAASLASLTYRATHAPSYFRRLSVNDTVVGFVCATRYVGVELTHESMSEHVEDGDSLAIHSVVVSPEFQRRGLATWMLHQYLQQLSELQRDASKCEHPVLNVSLLCKAALVTLYEGAGFKLIGPSKVVHGKDTWLEMRQAARGWRQQLFQVDAFASKAFEGNPAAVLVLPRPICGYDGDVDALERTPTAWMQQLAGEMNLSETAFVARRSDGRFNLRWMTPALEVDLCGHATLAASYLLDSQRLLPKSQRSIEFVTRSGVLTIGLVDSGAIEMDFPGDTPTASPEDLDDVVGSLGLSADDALFVGRGKFDVFVEVARTAFDKVKPDFGRIGRIDARGLTVTAAGTTGDSADFVSRFFAPQVGVDEDPVTGSAHCTLASYWLPKLGADRALQAFQASSRGGRLSVRYATPAEPGRIILSGSAVITMEATLASAAAEPLHKY